MKKRRRRCFAKPTATIILKKASGVDIATRKESTITIKVEKQIKEISSKEKNNDPDISNKSVKLETQKVEDKEQKSAVNKELPISRNVDFEGDAEESTLVIDERPEQGRRKKRKQKKVSSISSIIVIFTILLISK